jgi:hypothetical protein
MDQDYTLSDMAEAYALDAVDHAQSRLGETLDFSPESIRTVERILDMLHESLPKTFLSRLFRQGPSESDLETMCKMYGSYVGEVIRRTGGGSWELKDGQVTLVKKDTVIWPTAKVYKRIVDGAGNDVWAYFQAMMGEHWGAPEGDLHPTEQRAAGR